MRAIRITGLFLSIAALTAGSALAAQYWPKPASTPGVDVKCTGCVAPHTGLLTPGYPTTITKFVGRFLDSDATQDCQQPFRTVRAFHVMAAPSRGRIYMINGSAAMAYDIDRFFSRVASNEALVTKDPRCYPMPGLFLGYDSYFYAEDASSGWHFQIPDGQERLFGIDYDDQGYVYLAYSFYGWGIVKDDGLTAGNPMQSAVQWYAQDTSDDVFPPQKIAALKGSDGRYYALVSAQTTSINIFDVTDRTNPVRRATSSRSLFNFARTPAGDRIALATANGRMQIFTTDSIVAGGLPLVDFPGAGGPVHGVACDGTNFYATSDSNSGLVISVFAPSGSGYTRTDFPTTSAYVATQSLTWGDGYLVWANGSNLRVFKLQNGIPVEIDFGNYFQHYYTGPIDATYTKPSFSYFWDSTVVKRGNHTYLVVMGYSLGDVYELPSTDSIAVNNLGVSGTMNPNVPSGGSTGPFPGDSVAFNATTGAPAPMNIVWDFGDGSTAAGVTGTQIPHQYSGATLAGASSKSVTVTATNALDLSIKSSVPVTLQKPAVRFGVGNYKYLFVQPNASSPAPIVAGDSFFDASDGTVQSHYDTWNIDGVPVNMAPPAGASVGACGQRTLIFDANYGPYTPSGPTSLGPNMPIGIHNFVYSVRPFAAGIDVTSDAVNVTFSSLSRVSTDSSAISQPATLTYKWELLDGQNLPVTAAGSLTGTVTGVAVPAFLVPKSLFTGLNFRAHLTLTSPGGVGAACAGLTSAEAFTDRLNPPDPVIQGACTGTNGGPPCSFTVASVSLADTSGWTYLWSVSPTTGVTPTSSTSNQYTPSFGTAGSYTVSVKVTNSINSTTVSKGPFSVPGATCQTMDANHVFISFSGATSGCTTSSGTCSAGEQVTLTVSAFPPYDFSCAAHTFAWNFGGSTKTVTHAFSATTAVSVTIFNGSQTYIANATVTVGGYTPPPPPPPPPPPSNPPPGGCASMNSNDVFITFSGASGCTQNGGTCAAGEQVALAATAFPPYDFACANHTFSWSFGGSTRTVTHAFTSTTAVSVTISNGSQTYTATANVPVGGGGTPPPNPPPNPPPGGSCGTLAANTSVFVSYTGPQSGCTQYAGDCNTSETIPFEAQTFNYALSCISSFDWNFGDGTPHGAASKASHRYVSAGAFSLKLTVTANGQSYVMSQTVKVAGSQPTVNYQFDFTTQAIPNVPNAYTFKAFPTTNAASATLYNWDFGDGNTCSACPELELHAYSDSKDYPVTLSVPGYQGSVQHKLQDKQRHRPSTHP